MVLWRMLQIAGQISMALGISLLIPGPRMHPFWNLRPFSDLPDFSIATALNYSNMPFVQNNAHAWKKGNGFFCSGIELF